MAENPSAPEPAAPASAPAPAPASESASTPLPKSTPVPESKSAPASGADGNPEDHLGNIVQGLYSGAALVRIGYNRVLSSLRSLKLPGTFPEKTLEAPRIRSTKASTICKHIWDLYEDCGADRDNNCKPCARLVKHCTQLESTQSFKATDETSHGLEEDSNMPVPFDLILMAYHGCAGRSYSTEKRSACLTRYTELLQFLTQTNNTATNN